MIKNRPAHTASTDGTHQHEHAAGCSAPLAAQETPVENVSEEHDPESVVRSYYELVDANRIEDMLALFDDQAIYCRPGYEPLNGKSMLRSFYNGVRVIEHGTHQISRVIKEDRLAAVAGCFEGELKSGLQVNVRFSDIFSLNEQGLITERETFFFTPSI